MELPTYKLIINAEDQDTGVDFIALVDEPAIERGWVAFNKQQHGFKVKDKEKRIIAGPLMIPDMKIYRNDSNGEYNVVFDPETIELIVDKFHENGFNRNVNLMHDKSQKADGVFLNHSIIIGDLFKAPSGYEDLPDGTWFGAMKVKNDEIWEKGVKGDYFTGFSVEGIFNMMDFRKMSQDLFINQLQEILG